MVLMRQKSRFSICSSHVHLATIGNRNVSSVVKIIWLFTFMFVLIDPVRTFSPENPSRLRMNSVPMNSYEKNVLDKELIKISIVIPAFNEADRIPKTLKTYVSYMLDQYKHFEVVVVDDGSTDGTSNVVQVVSKDLGVPSEEIEFSSTNAEVRCSSTDISVLCLRLSQNVGKGQALRYGVQYSDPRCNFILVADADGSGDIRCLGNMVDGAIENYPQDTIVCGIRKRESVTFKRSLLTWGFKTAVQILCWPVINGVDDTQCGFKLLPRNIALLLYDNLHIRGWAYDVELVFLASLYASKNRFLLLQKPVNWTDEPGSKLVDNSFIGTAKVSIDMLVDVLYMRMMYILGVWQISD